MKNSRSKIVEPSLTEYEIPLLTEDFNLTDGHVYRNWSPEEDRIIGRASTLMRSVNRQMQPELEEQYVKALMALGRQRYAPDNVRYLICTTASESLEIVANHLRLSGKSLTLIEPCFDNLADIFARHGVLAGSLSDECLDSPFFSRYLDQVETSAICLVTPNNPTGRTITEDNFRTLLEFCLSRSTLLIIDSCFRAYIPDADVYDQYGMLSDSGVEFVVIEDTGKTWPTLELKASSLATKASLFDPIYKIYSDFLLHVSPFTIRLLTEFVQLSAEDHCAHLREIVALNRAALYSAIEGSFLTPQEERYASVSWLRTAPMSGSDVVARLRTGGVHVLAGDRFFWSDSNQGRQFIRVALTRTPSVFSEAMMILERLCHDMKPE